MAVAAALALAASPAPADEVIALLARGDAAWSRRGEGSVGLTARPEPIATAVDAYAAALALEPAPEIRERLLRALYFQGRFARRGADAKEVFVQGRDLAEQSLRALAVDPGEPLGPAAAAERFAGRRDAAAAYFWAAAHWGLWGEAHGKLAAARQGVAGRVRDYAAAAAAIDPAYEGGGGHRILGRLHTEAPRIPLVTGWIDREVAVTALERATELAPGHPQNRLYLADALLRFAPRRRGEAGDLLDELAAAEPRAEALLEDREVILEARRLRRGAAR